MIIVISPNYISDQTVFATTQNGVYKSFDGGNSWTQVNTQLSAFAISPNYATDQTIFTTQGGTVYKSIDGGISWTTSSTPVGVAYIIISPNYTNDKTIFVGGYGGVAQSSDGGVTWTLRNTGLTNLSVYSLAFSPNFATDQTVFVGTQDGLYKSTNSGSSWLKILNISDYPEALVLSPNYAIDQTIFVGFWNRGTYKSTNGGTSWTTINVNRITSFAISPNFPSDKTIFAGSLWDGIYKSIDGGNTWVLINNGIPITWVRVISISPNFAYDQTIFTGLGVNGDGPGIFKSTNGGNLWSEANTGINIRRQMSSLALSPDYANDNTIFAGTGGNGANDVYRSNDNGDTWTMIPNANGSVVAVSPNFIIDHTIFAGSWNSLNPVYKSIDGGNSWVQTGLQDQVSDIAVSPGYADDQIVFAAGNFGVYKSTNGGVSWSAANNGLSSGYKRGIVYSPNFTNDQTLFVGSWDGVFKTVTGGSTWTNVSSGLPQSPGSSGPYISSVVISPTYASDQTLFVGVSYKGVFKSTNGGTTWVQVRTSTTYWQKIAISPNYAIDQTIFTAEYKSTVYKSTDGGYSWLQLSGSGLSSSSWINTLTVSPNYANDKTLFAGTFDGVYSYTSATVCTDNDSDGYATEGGDCGVADCNDSNPLEHPNQVWYKDADNDGYSDGNIIVQCARPANYKVASELIATSGDCNDTNSVIKPGATEICDGVDNNCNGQVDEGVQNTYYRDFDGDTYGNATVTTHACTQPAGYVTNSTDCNDSDSSVNPGSPDAICDGVDSNCSGTADDGYVPTATSCGVGVCEATGQLICQNGQLADTCAAGNPTGSDDTCNGIDENCNGAADENYIPPQTSCGIGVCGAAGQLVCVGGQTQDTCTPGIPQVEVCDGTDNDCDGTVDDGIPSIITGSDVGACQTEIQSCVNGTMTIVQPAIGPSAEVCDGVDNDCNGQTDEGILDVITGTDVGACQTEIQSCVNGAMTVVQAGIGTSPEVCDLVDNDCDGLTDEDYPDLGSACSTGIGACSASGTMVCSGDGSGTVCNAQPGTPSAEIPNDGIDQDCNGQDLIVNTAPVVWDIPDVSFLEDGSGTLPGNASLDTYVSDMETLDPFISWIVIGGTNVTASINPDRTVTFTAAPDFNGQETLTFMATDTGYGTSAPLSASDTVVVTVTPVNDPPMLDFIGAKSVDEGTLLSFIVSGSDPEDDPLTFSATGLPQGAVFDPATLTFSWTPDFTQAGLHSVTFVVDDGVLTDYEMVTITANNVNRIPVADAGADETQHVGTLVTLDGSGSSDPDGDYPLTYAWNIISEPIGSTATLSDPSAVNPSFTADKLGDYTIGLVVTDSLGLSSVTDSVIISTNNTVPAADAGQDQAVTVIGTTIQLDGTQSYDLDGDTIYYTWTMTQKPAGSSAMLSDPSSPTPTFIADVHGDYEVELVVYDSWGISAPDKLIISFTNVKPVANPGGNQSVIEGDTVTLNGGGSSDANGDPLTYSWGFVSVPAGSTATLSSTTSVTTGFVADVPGTYVVSLIVNDGFINSDAANVTITATSRQDEAIRILGDAIDAINNLDPKVFKNRNMANVLTNKINATLEMIDQRLYQDALDKLENDIMGKTDSCATGGSPDRNDWIINCPAQEQVYTLLRQAIELLRGLV